MPIRETAKSYLISVHRHAGMPLILFCLSAIRGYVLVTLDDKLVLEISSFEVLMANI